MSKHHLSNPLLHREVLWGIAYLAAELLLIPGILYFLADRFFPNASEAAINFLFYLINFSVVCLIFRHFLKRNLAAARSRAGKSILYALLGVVLYWTASMVMGELTYQLMPEYTNVNDDAILQISRDGYLLMAIGTVLLVPTAEECLFRGLLFRGIHDRSRTGAYLVSSLCFAAVHVMGYIGSYDAAHLALCYVQYIPAGLVLAWAYEKSGTVFTPIAIHTIINAIGIYTMR